MATLVLTAQHLCEESNPIPRKKHISQSPVTLLNWYKHVDWLNTTVVVLLPFAGLVGAIYTPLCIKTVLVSIIYYFVTGLGITAGYHRLWAHRSYTASLPLQIWLAAFGGGALQNSIRRWSRDHRAHHRYTDTDKDPYSVQKGLLYSHIGWLVLKQNPKRLGRTDISDLNGDAVVMWQHKHYIEVVLVMGFALPTFICGLGWDDWWGGLIYAGIWRIFIVQQATFCVNSLAHWLGDQPFDDRNSPKDHILTALITLGEGYHNFHHEFPSDYRNAIAWHQYDPTKWSISLWKHLGLAYDLKMFRQNEIDKGMLQQEQKKLDLRRAQFTSSEVLSSLPVIDWEEFQRSAAGDHYLLVIAGVIYDVGGFMSDHPGGKALLRSSVGKDVTATFNGGVYNRKFTYTPNNSNETWLIHIRFK